MDKRDAATYGRPDGLKPDHQRMVLVDDYDELPDLPGKYEVCDLCNGTGKHVNPSIDANGLTASDFAEDPDFAVEYKRGLYDVPCYSCNGMRAVLMPDKDSLTKEQAAEILERIQEHYASLLERASELRYGY